MLAYYLKGKVVLVDSQDVEGAMKSIWDAICCELSLENLSVNQENLSKDILKEH